MMQSVTFTALKNSDALGRVNPSVNNKAAHVCSVKQ